MKIGRVPVSLARWRAFRLFSVAPLPKFNWFASKLNSIHIYSHTHMHIYIYMYVYIGSAFGISKEFWLFVKFFQRNFIYIIFQFLSLHSFPFLSLPFFQISSSFHRIWLHDIFRRIHTNYVKWEYSLALDLEAWLRTITNRFVFFSNDRRSPATK